MRLGDWTPTWTCPVPIQHCCITCPHQATLAAVIVISAWQLQVLLLCCFSRRRDGWCMHPQSNMLSAATAVEYQWQLVQLQSQASSWAAWYNTRLLIESTPKGVVFSFLFFSFLFFSFLFFSFLFFSFLFFSVLFFSFLFFSFLFFSFLFFSFLFFSFLFFPFLFTS